VFTNAGRPPRLERALKAIEEKIPHYNVISLDGMFAANARFLGYCQIQGLYLAARKYRQLKTFNEVKKEASKNIFPNF